MELLESKDGIEKLWQRIMYEKKNNCMMGCSAEAEEEGYIKHPITEEDTGIMSGHAYSI